MNDTHASAVSGFQIAFLIFAVVLLAAPADKYLLSQWQWAQDLDLPLGRAMIFAIAAFVLFSFPALRTRSASLLAAPIPRGRRRELVFGLALKLLLDLGILGAFALWHWSVGGEPALARAMDSSHVAQMEAALSTHGIVMFVFVAALIGPIIEEVVFRGMLFPAWKAAWGWLNGAVASGLVFGLFHGAFWPQFMGSFVYVCLLRKTGSLRAAIYVHALSNLLLWYPLLGQFMLPADRSTGELHLWTFHLACLVGALAALPWYLWSARGARAVDRT